MLKDITLGQYFPGNSAVHRLDPRTKLIFTVIYIVALYSAKSWVTYLVMLSVVGISVAVSGIPVSAMFRGLRPLAFILVFTAVLNLFYNKEGTVLVSFWVITVTTAGLLRSGYMILRLVLLITGTMLLTYTTTPMELTDGLEKLFNPLKKLRFPVHELALMMSLALRFIPALIDETDRIMSAQKARGANFETGRLTDRAKALLPLLVPLFVSAFRRSDELAVAMESRCYHGGVGRTRMKVLKMGGLDIGVLVFSVILLAGVLVLSGWGI